MSGTPFDTSALRLDVVTIKANRPGVAEADAENEGSSEVDEETPT